MWLTAALCKDAAFHQGLSPELEQVIGCTSQVPWIREIRLALIIMTHDIPVSTSRQYLRSLFSHQPFAEINIRIRRHIIERDLAMFG
jgi:hypothetical protein